MVRPAWPCGYMTKMRAAACGLLLLVSPGCGGNTAADPPPITAEDIVLADDLRRQLGIRERQDSDLDELRDELDKCPDSAEDYNGVDDSDGCPEKGK